MEQPSKKPREVMLGMRDPGARELLDVLVDFCRRHGPPKCYAGWPEHLVKDYLAWHAGAKTVWWMVEPFNPRGRLGAWQVPDKVLGVAVAWPDQLRWINSCTEAGRCVFDWRPVDWAGSDCVYLADWVVLPDRERRTEIPTRRQVVQMLARTFYSRWPGQRGKAIVFHRGTRLVQMSGRMFEFAGIPGEEATDKERMMAHG